MKNLLKSIVVSIMVASLFSLPILAQPPKPLDKNTTEKVVAKPSSEVFWIGVRVAPVPDVLLPQFGVEEDGPGRIVVEKVVADGPAAKADLKRGDVILEFGGVTIHTLGDLIEQINKAKATPQQAVVLRGGKNVNLAITPQSRPVDPVVAEEEFVFDNMPGIRIDEEFTDNFRHPQLMMRHMENMFRQMQGGTDDAGMTIDKDVVSESDNFAKGDGKRVEVRSHIGPDGKKQVQVTKSVTTEGKTQKHSWIVESIEKLPEEIRKEVEAIF